jgi:hypothetical protein
MAFSFSQADQKFKLPLSGKDDGLLDFMGF